MGDHGMDNGGRFQREHFGGLPLRNHANNGVLLNHKSQKPGMEPKLLSLIYALVAYPFLGATFLGYIGAVNMADWKVNLFFIVWLIAFLLRLYYRHIEKDQKRKLTDIEIERQRRELDGYNDDILPFR